VGVGESIAVGEVETERGRQLDAVHAAAKRWQDYTEAGENLLHLTHEGLTTALELPELLRATGAEPARVRHAEWKADRARVEVETDFPTLHAHSLLGLFGAFESFVEDVVIGTLRTRPSLLGNDKFTNIKLPVSTLLLADAESQARAVIDEVARHSKSDLAVGIGKFEKLLAFVELDGQVPEKIRTAVFQAQQVRNVWAHRGGLADERFVQRCGSLGFQVDQRVNLSTEAFLPLMHGMHMYAIVILNRCLQTLEMPELQLECHGYKGILAEIGV
jgi:hypothetical protein